MAAPDYKNLLDFSGKIALVSGASRGIGEAIAHGLAANGAEVIVSSRRLESCEKVAAEIVAAGGRATARACHQGNMEDIERLFNEIEGDQGKLDVLVNCGGTSPYYGPIDETPESAFDKTFEVNLKGPFFMSSRAIALMRASGGGSIVNVASINGMTPGALRGVYSMTKAAMISMTKAYAKECGVDGIRVNAIAPGLVQTKLAAALTDDEEMLKGYIDRFAIKRVGQPADMVAGTLFLASDAAGFTTGITLTMDAGVTI